MDHLHPDAIEICFLVKGRQTYRVRGRDYRMTGGDVFMTYPGEVHSSAGLPQEKGILYWLTLAEPRRGINLLNLPVSQARALYRAIRNSPCRHFRGSWRMKGHLDAIALLSVQQPSALKAFTLANAVGAFLLEVVACAKTGEKKKTAPDSLRSILDFIEANLETPLSVPELATRTGLSASRFKARFKEETGVPPGEYVLRARVREAQRRLDRHDATITQIAFDLGFTSSQYFATVFKTLHRIPAKATPNALKTNDFAASHGLPSVEAAFF